MANKLNIPKQNSGDKFEQVSFVNSMTLFQLKTLVKNMWENMGELADAMDKCGRTDVSDAIDKMRDGNSWSDNKFRKRFRYANNNNDIIVYDSKTDTFRVLDTNGNYNEIQAVEQKDVMKSVKQIAKGK